MHHRIGLLVIVITSTYPVPTPQPKIRMGLFFYVKILENNSVYEMQMEIIEGRTCHNGIKKILKLNTNFLKSRVLG